MARPTKTEMNKKKILDLYVKAQGNVSLMCQSVGISRKTFYEWMKIDEEFKQQIEDIDIDEMKLDLAEHKLGTLIQEKNFPAIKFFLENKGESRGYGQSGKVTIEADGKALENIRPQIIFANTTDNSIEEKIIDEDE